MTHNLALKNDGNTVGWGRNYEGELSFPLSLTNVIGVAADFRSSMALFPNGQVLALGQNNSGANGITNMPSNLTNVVTLAVGGFHALALRTDGTVVAWGQNSSGQTNVPAGLSNVVAIAGGYHSCPA